MYWNLSATLWNSTTVIILIDRLHRTQEIYRLIKRHLSLGPTNYCQAKFLYWYNDYSNNSKKLGSAHFVGIS